MDNDSSLAFFSLDNLGYSLPTIDVRLSGYVAKVSFFTSITIEPTVSATNIHDSILPVTSRFSCPFEPVVISNEPLSKTKLIVLVKSALAVRAVDQKSYPAVGAGVNVI